MKRVSLIVFVVIIALTSLGVAGAQGPDAPPPDGGRVQRPGGQQAVVIGVVAEITGLTEEEILRQMREDDKTLAEIITENGGDLEAAKAQIKTALTDSFSENVDQVVDNLLNKPLPKGNRQGGQDNRNQRPGEAGLPRDIVQAVGEATGLDPQVILEQWRGGATLAEIATANGADPNAIVTTVTTNAAARLDTAVENGRITREEADAQLARLNEGLNKVMNITQAQMRADGLVMPALIQASADELDMNPREMLEQIEEGQTPADFITANGGDVAAVTAAALANVQEVLTKAVENERLTQAEADEILGLVGASITEKLNTPFERPRQPNRGGRNRPNQGGPNRPNQDGQNSPNQQG